MLIALDGKDAGKESGVTRRVERVMLIAEDLQVFKEYLQ
jgi:hypothetical protein